MKKLITFLLLAMLSLPVVANDSLEGTFNNVKIRLEPSTSCSSTKVLGQLAKGYQISPIFDPSEFHGGSVIEDDITYMLCYRDAGDNVFIVDETGAFGEVPKSVFKILIDI